MASKATKQRIIELDALRGISLFGILLMNILVFSFPYNHTRLDLALQGVNGFLFRLVSLFVIDSFYPIFSFLFGFSLMLIYKSTHQRGIAFKPVMLRRLLFLMMIGLLHGYLLNSGDILLTYAVMGFGAMWLTQFSIKKLKKLAIILFGIKVVVWGLPFLIMGWLTKAKLPLSGGDQAELQALVQAKTSPHYMDFFIYNAQDNFAHLITTLTADWIDIFPYLLIGMAAMKGNLVEWVKQHPAHATQIGSLFIIIGTGLKFIGAYIITNPGYMMFSFTIGGPLFSVGIVLLFFRVMQYTAAQKLLKPFRYPGKMSLSVYLTQSIVCVLFFAGFGFGFYNQLPLYQTYLFALALFFIQVVICYVYQRHFTQGPFEWLWRKVTYFGVKTMSSK
ncbi:DUF418 domain-containing protein [Staphylococcus delphini]|uniref:DUF418 domain-containing protein n=1 Tax=Staphylococcus delphini TaxID=53344 RepID=UPI000BBB8F39|nr:DUF418 domain-containing protein [Staphylococcus delphini]MDE9829961.1 DUF418 domain-containing protein [Staphylococcus delphini]PCF83669.1 hypothetical protein B4W69_07640 [Staphylococcus delphini]